jgi:hypothetical protein
MTAPIASGWSESPGGACTHWKAPPCHGAPPQLPFPTAAGIGSIRVDTRHSRSGRQAAIEDLFEDQFYIECVNAAFGIAFNPDDLPIDGSDMITKRVESVLVQRYGKKELDKRRVMTEILRRFDGWEKVADLPEGTSAKAEKLFSAVNRAFGD